MNNPWKLATLALALIGVTALSTGLTTAYLLRPTTPAEAVTPATLTGPAAMGYAPAPAPRAVPARPVARRAPVVTPAVATPAPPPVVRTASVQTVADDCSTGGQRAMKIAKPGLIGALAGAGLGAVGGAIADGGKAAGKGALIGGLAGAAVGGGYGAYKTKQECGTIFGNTAGFAGSTVQAADPVVTPQSAVHAAGAGSGIQVFNAR